MKGLFRVIVLMALIMPVAFANAQAKRGKKKPMSEEMSGQGYGVAGCGLGSIVFGPKTGWVQIVAATLNGTGVQTFGITTGTSNCDMGEGGLFAASFIESNREVVTKEFARGRGETVDSLAYILRCNDTQVFGDKMKENYGKILENGIDSYETTRRIMKTIESTPELKSSCSTVG